MGLWDNLQLDVTAAFDPIRLPLAEIRQMSEGLVVELGGLADNQISLMVDAQTVARGRLVVVGDRFGVVIEKLEQTPVEGANADVSFAPPPAPQQQPQAGGDMDLFDQPGEQQPGNDDFINDGGNDDLI